MIQYKNIQLYTDDNKIIDILNHLPQCSDLKNLTILEFIEKETKGANFGVFYMYNNIIYVVYKFDEEIHKNEAGLIMSKSHIRYAIQHYELWSKIKSIGLNITQEFIRYVYNSAVMTKALSLTIT
jgi:hypothetical protein